MLPGEKGVEDTVGNSFSRIHSDFGINKSEGDWNLTQSNWKVVCWWFASLYFFGETRRVEHEYNEAYDLSTTLAKSGPLDFPSEKSFLLFFAHEKGLGNMCQK